MPPLQAPPDALIHVVDDDPVLLESIGWLLRSIDIPFKTYPSATDFLAGYDAGKPACLILDVRMPGMSGLELQDFLNADQVEMPIIFISGHSDVPLAVRAMKHGAIEFLQKPFDQNDLFDALGRAFAMVSDRQAAAQADGDTQARLGSLSPREREILKLLMQGQSAKEVGKTLSISPRTVEYHRNNILEKMDARSIVSLAALVGKLAD